MFTERGECQHLEVVVNSGEVGVSSEKWVLKERRLGLIERR